MAGGAGGTDHALERLVFFSDAVFAIAITLLVIELHVPHIPRGAPDSAYWQALAQLVPSFIGYFFSFFVIGAFWAGHHRAFTLAGRYSAKVLSWNMVFLLTMAFMPFVTAFLSQNIGARVPTVVYCAVMLAAALLNMRVQRIVTGPDMLAADVAHEDVAYVRKRGLSVALGAATALAVSFVVPVLGQVSLATIPLWRRLIARMPKGEEGA
ncbi:MAG: DUF1211 domain-containing protein [Alphaproteobacteria bacterium]|nr:DUF1211 domain-containing protein [Alphaproteobacteria bacterium]MBV9370322.1 DUF1211 domain-containing protein [Alphaproteobacteria bacterium]MBV9902021.1 DUF1211 domain-containing protein [Alphaproteobacteria bacterium]